MVQLALLQFAILLMNNAHLVLSISTVMIANRTPHMLREFMETSGGNTGLGGKVSTATRTVSSFKNIISKGR
nr:conjugal transfer protein TrbL family protein [uncultured Clostridium sp.]